MPDSNGTCDAYVVCYDSLVDQFGINSMQLDMSQLLFIGKCSLDLEIVL